MRWALGVCVLVSLVGCQRESKNEYYEPEAGVAVPYGKSSDKFKPTTIDRTEEEKAALKFGYEADLYFEKTVSTGNTPATTKKLLEEGLKKYGKVEVFQLSCATHFGFNLKVYPRSIAIYQEILKVNPEQVAAKACLGLMLIEQGKASEGKKLLEDVEFRQVNVRNLTPNSTELQMRVLFAQVTIGPENLREKELRTLVQFFPNGIRIPNLDPAPYIKEAKASNQVDQEWIPKLAAVCQGKAKPHSLDDWEIIKHIRP